MAGIQVIQRHLDQALHDPRSQKRVLWILCALSLVFVIASIPAKTRMGYGHPLLPPRDDPFGHYVYMPALLLHHNVQFQSLLERYIEQNPSPAHVDRPGLAAQIQQPAKQALLRKKFTNYWSVGHAVLLSPFFIAGQSISFLLSKCGVQVDLDGFAWPNQVSTAIGVILLFFFALSRFHDLLVARFGCHVAGPLSLVAFAGTFFLNYTLNEQYMAHASTFFASVFYLRALVDINNGQDAPLQFGIAAFWLGLIILVRPQNALLCFPLLALFLVVAIKRQHRHLHHSLWIKRCMLLTLLGGSICLIQFVLWKHIFGKWTFLPQGDGFLDLRSPSITAVLFGKRHGFFYWHPFLLLGAGITLLHLLRHGLRSMANGLLCGTLLSCLCITYLNACAADWWAGTSFGARRFDGLIVFILYACAHGLSRLSRHRPRLQNVTILAYCFGAILWNGTIWLVYLFDLSPFNFPKS
jgi:hypothetical protein